MSADLWEHRDGLAQLVQPRFNDEDFARRPELFFRSLGISQMCNILSGSLGTLFATDVLHRFSIDVTCGLHGVN